jgi:hypothetical protein
MIPWGTSYFINLHVSFGEMQTIGTPMPTVYGRFLLFLPYEEAGVG